MIGKQLVKTKVYDNAVKLIFLANGFGLATIIPHFPWIKQIHEMGDALMGFVLLFPAIGAVSMMLLTGNLIQRFGAGIVTKRILMAVYVVHGQTAVLLGLLEVCLKCELSAVDDIDVAHFRYKFQSERKRMF